jgi:glyoxylase-like metal-dependent hydrolase (beta-lactamase superfamily II)
MMPQTAAVYHRKVGDILVTVINDGHFEGALEMVQGIPAEAVAQTLTDSFRPTQPPMMTVNMFVLRHGDRTAIIDSGWGNGAGAPPGAGLMGANLAVAGIDLAGVDTALITHLHPDHSLGLILPDGSARFPNATLHAHENEIGFWLDEETAAKAPDGVKPFFAMAQGSAAPYRSRLEAFTTGEVFPGVTAVPLPGHTPGHSGFLLSSNGESLLIWGDVFHVPEVQARYPAATIGFDVNPAQAADTRMQTLDRVATDRTAIAGMHLHFPTFSHVAKAAEGYALIPEAWAPV